MIPLPLTVVLLVGAVIASFAFHLQFATGLLVGFAFVNELMRSAVSFSQAQPSGGLEPGQPVYTESRPRRPEDV